MLLSSADRRESTNQAKTRPKRLAAISSAQSQCRGNRDRERPATGSTVRVSGDWATSAFAASIAAAAADV